ncbi:MAG: hypothetical protein WBN28_01830 [Lutimonas sp.]|jgi:uncharacterized membrane protein YkoI
MRNIKIILFVLLVVILSMSTYGQEAAYQNKVELQKVPTEVTREVNQFKGYKVTKAAYKLENNKKVYRLEIEKGKSKHTLLVDEKGKIIGREEG